MSVKVTFSDRFQESIRLHGEFFQHLHALVQSGVLLVIAAFGLLNPWMTAVLLPVCFLISIFVGAFLPETRQSAKCRLVKSTRERLLEKNSEVLALLSLAGRNHYNRLNARVSRLSDMLPTDSGTVVKPGEYLLWLYLKLLIARDHLEANAVESSQDSLLAQKKQVELEISNPSISDGSRQAKQQTLQLLDQRITAARMRIVRIEEVTSDLQRIEHQLALLCDRAADQSPLAEAGFRIDLATESVASAFCGELPGGLNVQQVEEIFSSHLTN